MSATLKQILLCVSSALLAVGLSNYFRPVAPPTNDAVRPRLTNYRAPTIALPRGETVTPATLYPNFVNAAALVTPAVVNIKSLSGSEISDIWSRERRIDASSGSGVILSADGYIVTNNHVIAEGTDIEVTLDDRREYEAEVVGRDPSTDLALIKIEAEGLPFVRFGDSDSAFGRGVGIGRG